MRKTPLSTTATAAVNDAGAYATADAADAGDHHGQDNADQDHPHPPARPALSLATTCSHIVSTLVLAGAGASPETLKEVSHSLLGILISSSSIILQQPPTSYNTCHIRCSDSIRCFGGHAQ